MSLVLLRHFAVQIAYGIARALLTPVAMYTIALGLFTTGCAPGGGASNFWTILLKGNADLSVTMTFLSTVASLGESSPLSSLLN